MNEQVSLHLYLTLCLVFGGSDLGHDCDPSGGVQNVGAVRGEDL